MNGEKLCRKYAADKGVDVDFCKIFVKKTYFELSCSSNKPEINWRSIHYELPEIRNLAIGIESKISKFLCDCEEYVPKRISEIDSKNNLLTAITSLIILWFAGPWSDRKNRRLSCMLLPYLGEAIGFGSKFKNSSNSHSKPVCLLNFHIFQFYSCHLFLLIHQSNCRCMDVSKYFDIFTMKQVLILHSYIDRIITAITGAENLMKMASFSYLTVTTEENRTFRYAIFSVVLLVVPLIGSLAGPFLINNFSYAVLFGMFIPIHIIGFIYFFKLKEPQEYVKIAATAEEIENLELKERGEATHQRQQGQNTRWKIKELDIEVEQVSHVVEKEPENSFYGFECIIVVIKKRKDQMRLYLIFLLVAYFLSYCIPFGEEKAFFKFLQENINWDVASIAFYKVYQILVSTFGTILITGVVGKLLNVADVYLALISIIFSILSKFVYMSSTTTGFYIGSTVDAAGNVKALAIRSIISHIVKSNEISTTFSVIGVLEIIGHFIFEYLYSTIHQSQKSDKDIFMISNLMLSFIIILG